MIVPKAQALRPELAEGTRRVLVFAKLFPPCNCWPTASERAVGLARGLSSLGWRPVVITRQLPAEGCTCGAGTVGTTRRRSAKTVWK